MIRRLSVAAAVAFGTLLDARAQSAPPIAIYVDAASTNARDYSIDVDGTVVPAAALIPGPHPLSAIVLHDVSTSVQPVSLDSVARQIANAARPGDHIRLASFADRIVIGSTPIVDRSSATAAAREATQAGGASPLWDAICSTVEALRNSSGVRAIVVFSDGQASANDRGADDALDVATRAGVIVSVVGLADGALRVPSEMEVFGRNGALRRLAADTGGGFVELRSRTGSPEASIADALKDLRGRMRAEFLPPVRDGALHRVSVTAGGRRVYGPARLRF